MLTLICWVIVLLGAFSLACGIALKSFEFALVQFASGVAMIVGWFLLIPFCIARAWHTEPSSTPGLTIAVWNSDLLNTVYGNEEDGVLGLSSYMAGKPEWLRAYLWSAWRNSADNLKYHFRWRGGPFKRWEFNLLGFSAHPWYVQLGWNGRGLPVVSAGAR